MSVDENQNGNGLLHTKCKATEHFTDGINTCILLLFTCLTINLGIENYSSYGIIKSPIQLIVDFGQFLQHFWWIYPLVISTFFLQIYLCYIIEKQLSLGKLSEEKGIVLHAFNTLLVLNVSSAVFYIVDFSPAGGISIMGYLFFLAFKVWSFVITNQKCRLQLQKKETKEKNEIQGDKPKEENSNGKTLTSEDQVVYPQNVTFINLVKFLNTTSSVIYNINGVKSKPRDLKKSFKLFLSSIFIHFLVAFLVYQYIFPETDRAIVYINNLDLLNFVGVVFKLFLPVAVVWLLYFYFYCFECYMVFKNCFWGTEDVSIRTDWWNAETTSIYWTKWNIQIHVALKEYVFLPVLRKGYSKRMASLAVAVVSGLLHEYLISIPCRAGYGLALTGMLFQIPFAFITTYLHKNFGAKWGNFVFWGSLLFGEIVFVIAVYYTRYNV